MKFAAYIRVSSKRQVEESDSLEGQRKQIELWAEREGHQIVAEYCDSGLSAFNGFRPQFEKMLQDETVDPPSFEGIVAYNFSRLSRNQLQFLNALKQLHEARIEVKAVNEIAKQRG